MDKKILIIVAIAIIIAGIAVTLFIVASGPHCSVTGKPEVEIASKMSAAKTGAIVTTTVICVNPNYYLGVVDIRNRMAPETIMFKCDGEVCSDTGPLIVTDNTITAKAEARFKVRVDCKETDSESYTCNLTVLDANY